MWLLLKLAWLPGFKHWLSMSCGGCWWAFSKCWRYCKTPSDGSERQRLANQFYTYKYPNVTRSINWTMITQQVPAINMTNHFTRKHTTVLHLTVCCDGNKQFLNINAEQSARCHDSHIFQHFQLFTILNNGQNSTQYHTYVKICCL